MSIPLPIGCLIFRREAEHLLKLNGINPHVISALETASRNLKDPVVSRTANVLWRMNENRVGTLLKVEDMNALENLADTFTKISTTLEAMCIGTNGTPKMFGPTCMQLMKAVEVSNNNDATKKTRDYFCA